MGDVNNDGEINVLDIVRIVNIILNIEPEPTSGELLAGDVNFDDSVNIQDAIIIIQYILGTYGECEEDETTCWNDITSCCPIYPSHNFTWDIQIFGAPSGNINSLYDAHILSDDDIWVVGEVRNFDGDSLHNYIHWDGEGWTQGIINENNDLSEYPRGLYDVFGFSDNDLWIASTLPSYYDGIYWYMYLPTDDGFPPGLGGINDMWGTSSNSMYFSKYSGDIIHWNGEEFTIMETTTGSGSQYNPPFPIRDMYGLDDNHIWTLAGNLDLINNEYPLKLSFFNGENWSDLLELHSPVQEDSVLSGRMYKVWAFDDTLYVSAALRGVWRESISTGEGSYFPLDSLSYINAGWSRGRGLDGNNYNDIYTVSQIAKYAHFNGSSWYFGNEVYDYFMATDYYHFCGGMAVKDDTIILYGDINLGAHVWVARGTRVEE
ncbi:MAG: hypothetical protein HQ510_07955 [Candidatus Marinimicrobia bacterium]|nr:hypothetical protein [Candidatus Neomarinimicrobiota bacterium]